MIKVESIHCECSDTCKSELMVECRTLPDGEKEFLVRIKDGVSEQSVIIRDRENKLKLMREIKLSLPDRPKRKHYGNN